MLTCLLFAGACTAGSQSGATQPGEAPTTVATSHTTQNSEVDGSGRLVWERCGDEVECAFLPVPLDYSEPNGETITIALNRVGSTGTAEERIGSVVFNPGGPGASGLEYLTDALDGFPPELRKRFDMVGFDPRGVGASSAYDCDIDWDDNVPTLDGPEDPGWSDVVALGENQAAGCDAEDEALLQFVGTNNSARDLDRIRQALGDDQLTYVGYSYGTRLGATYAELFPQNVRALVLDGGVKPTVVAEEIDLEQAEGFDLAFGNFSAACEADSDCLLNRLGTVEQVYREIEAELADGATYPAGGGRELTLGEFQLGVLAALYSADIWDFLSQAMYVAATDQDGQFIQLLADLYLGASADGYSNLSEANSAINCADERTRPDEASVRASANASADRTKIFAPIFRTFTGCLGIPEAIDPITIGPAVGAAPILVLGNTGDPATPYQWSVELAGLLDSGVLYTADAEGHTAYLSIDCVEPVVNDYLLDLTVPEPGGSCNGKTNVDFFAG